MASVTNPAQFLVSGPEIEVNSALVDPQGWDRYWELKADLDAGDIVIYGKVVSVLRRL